MRDIKYRGKRVSDGKWVYGYYVYADVTKKSLILSWENGIPVV